LESAYNFDTQIEQFAEEEKKLVPILSPFLFFGPQKTHSRVRRHENTGKHLFYFGLRIIVLIQIQLLEIENPKKSKIGLLLHSAGG
jgi:hypothetical protein